MKSASQTIYQAITDWAMETGNPVTMGEMGKLANTVLSSLSHEVGKQSPNPDESDDYKDGYHVSKNAVVKWLS